MKSAVLTVYSTDAEQLQFLKILLKSYKTIKFVFLGFFFRKSRIKIQK